MSKRQDTIDQILKWIEDIHKTECDLYRYIHRNDDWHYMMIGKKCVYVGDNEYIAYLNCSKCGTVTEIAVKRGVDIHDMIGDIKCQQCDIKFNIKKGKTDGCGA